jgi:hypothetical protein
MVLIEHGGRDGQRQRHGSRRGRGDSEHHGDLFGTDGHCAILVVGSAQYPLLQIFSFSVPEVGRTNRVLVRYFQTPTTPARDVSLEATLTSSDPDVFSVESAQVTGRAPGTAILMATFGGAQASAYGSVPPLRSLP